MQPTMNTPRVKLGENCTVVNPKSQVPEEVGETVSVN